MSSARRLVRLPGPFTMRNGGVLPAGGHRLRDLGGAGPGPLERPAARHRPVAERARPLVARRPDARLVGGDDRPRPGARHGPLPRHLRELAGQPSRLDQRRHPSTRAPARPYRLTFPILAIEDIARAAREALRALGLPRVRAVVGPSLGGMTALAYAIQFPDEVYALVTISSAARATPFAIAIRSVQREAIRSDPEWRGGDYEPPGPVNGLRVARKLGLITYRSAAEWRQRFSRERVEVRAAGGGPVRRGVRDRGLPGDARAEVRGQLRRELLPLPLPLHGPVRRGGARRLGGGRARPHPGAPHAGRRRGERLPVPDRPAGGDRRRARARRARRAAGPPAFDPGPRLVPGRLRPVRARRRLVPEEVPA